jgi:predicted MFS family arabinose efflux permease
MSGVLCGILLGRAVGGFTADHLGWRATFWLAAAMTTIIWLVLLVKLPHSEPKTSHSYLGLMKSLMELWREELPLRRAFNLRFSVLLSAHGQFWRCVYTRPLAWVQMWQVSWGLLVQQVF